MAQRLAQGHAGGPRQHQGQTQVLSDTAQCSRGRESRALQTDLSLRCILQVSSTLILVHPEVISISM